MLMHAYCAWFIFAVHASCILSMHIVHKPYLVCSAHTCCTMARANLFQPIKGFHFLRLYPIKWAIYEDRCLYIGINVKARFSNQTPTSTPLAISLVYPLIVTLLWCFNTVLYLWSRFIYYLVLLCYIIYIQSKSYVNVYITLKDILLKSHEIMLIFANLNLIGYINIVMICHLPHA